jgi:hypothetical protein
MPDVVECRVLARLMTGFGASWQELVRLRYLPEDPFAVQLVFPGSLTLSGRPTSWVFGRELLMAGLRGPAGIGDVRLWPQGARRLMAELRSPEAVALVELDAAAVRVFVRHSCLAVPPGGEHRRLDHRLADLFRQT